MRSYWICITQIVSLEQTALQVPHTDSAGLCRGSSWHYDTNTRQLQLLQPACHHPRPKHFGRHHTIPSSSRIYKATSTATIRCRRRVQPRRSVPSAGRRLARRRVHVDVPALCRSAIKCRREQDALVLITVVLAMAVIRATELNADTYATATANEKRKQQQRSIE